MPIVQVNMLEGRSVEQKRRMITAVTGALVESLGIAADSVRILIQELPAEHFAVAGVSAGERPLGARRANGASRGAGSDAPQAMEQAP